jgi:hypothetical protein
MPCGGIRRGFSSLACVSRGIRSFCLTAFCLWCTPRITIRITIDRKGSEEQRGGRALSDSLDERLEGREGQRQEGGGRTQTQLLYALQLSPHSSSYSSAFFLALAA